jgi:hypothetical protein
MFNRKSRYILAPTVLLFVVILSAFWAKNAFASCTYTVTNTNASGAGSLPGAIGETNESGGGDTICFDIPGGTYQTIMVDSMLMITEPVVIDGTTQPGYSGTPVIEIDGSNAGSGTTGFDVTAGNTTIKGLVVNRFGGDGIILNNNGGDTVQNDYVGTNSAGTVAYGNGASGIGIASNNNLVGGTTPSERNLVSGNVGTGIAITDGSDNTVEGNYIGTDPTGTTAIGNGADGILLNEAPNNTIGGTTGVTPGGSCTGACNLSSGNGSNGIGILASDSSGNTVEGNYAGVDVYGTAALPNDNIGFEAQDAPNNTIGGTTPAARNIFSGNLGAGVSLTSTDSTGDVVEGNYIGVDVTGQAPIGNAKMGVNIGSPSGGSNNASDNTIGGTTGVTPGGSCTGACNVISANGWSGIYISGSTGGDNSIVGNFIGPSASGGDALGNQMDGVGIVDSPNNRFGGPATDARNLMSGNGGNGVAIVGSSATGTRVEGNYIGEATNAGCMPNNASGVNDESALDTAVIGNNIFCSGYKGIDLGSGANDGQSYPTLSAAYPSGTNTNVIGSLYSVPNTSFRVDIFSSPYCGESGRSQGQSFLGTANVTTNSSGNVAFNISVDGTGDGAAITSTATQIISGTPWETSEFSGCVYTPYQHPDGTLIQPVGSQNIFQLSDGQVEPVGSLQVLASYNVQPGDIKTATTADTNLTETSSALFFRDGTLLQGSGSAIYVVDQPSPGTYTKSQITSGAVFSALGYTTADIISVPESVLDGISDGSNISSASQHPNGTLVENTGNGTLYWIDNNEKYLIGSPEVFVSNDFNPNLIMAATAADLALTSGPNLGYGEGSIVAGSGSAIYAIVNDTANGYEKRQFSSAAAFTGLGYNLGEVLSVPNSDLPTANGPSI